MVNSLGSDHGFDYSPVIPGKDSPTTYYLKNNRLLLKVSNVAVFMANRMNFVERVEYNDRIIPFVYFYGYRFKLRLLKKKPKARDMQSRKKRYSYHEDTVNS